MNEGIWNFRPKDKSEKNVGNTFGEFFNSRDFEFPGKALVREVIQNSLDAKQENEKPVIVKFSLFNESQSVNPSAFSYFIQGLETHLNAIRSDIREISDTTSPMPFLVIEDFNTRGLEGDPSDFNEEQACREPEKNNFYYFWRNWGISSKADKDRGRWGVGKVVFPKSSKICSYYGFTIRDDDNKHFLMGESVIKQHYINGITYDLFGDYGRFEQCDEKFVMPIEDPEILNKFKSTFHVSRTDEPGLSILIPYVKDEITSNNLILAVINQFFYPIISGILIVEIGENNKKTVIHKENLLDALDIIDFNDPLIKKENIQKEKLRHLIEFTSASLAIPDKKNVRINDPDLTKKPDWNNIKIEEKTLEDLITRFESQEIISFDIAVKATLTGGTAEKGQFKVFIQNDEELQSPDYSFIREGLIIGKAGTFSARGVRALVVIDKAPLTNLLGDAENVSHSEWRQNSDKFHGKYEHGPSTLIFVRKSLNELVSRLNQKRVIDEPDLLVDFFSVASEPENPEVKPKKPLKKPGKKILPEKVILPKPKPALVNIEKIAGGGVKISRNAVNAERIERISLEFAYDTGENDPFAKYSPWDFKLESKEMKIESKGIQNIEKSGQNINCEITENEFEINVFGFDPRRDVKVCVVKEAVNAR